MFERVGTTARNRMFCWKYFCLRIFFAWKNFMDINCKCKGRFFCLRIFFFANSCESQSELVMKPCQKNDQLTPFGSWHPKKISKKIPGKGKNVQIFPKEHYGKQLLTGCWSFKDQILKLKLKWKLY